LLERTDHAVWSMNTLPKVSWKDFGKAYSWHLLNTPKLTGIHHWPLVNKEVKLKLGTFLLP